MGQIMRVLQTRMICQEKSNKESFPPCIWYASNVTIQVNSKLTTQRNLSDISLYMNHTVIAFSTAVVVKCLLRKKYYNFY